MFTPVQRAAIQSYIVSIALSFWTAMRVALSIAIVGGTVTDFHSAFTFVFSPKVLFLIVAGSVLDIGPYYRSNQGIKNYGQANPAPPQNQVSEPQRDKVV